jgi:anti-anti-sigma factor
VEFTLSTSERPPTVTLTANGDLDIFTAREVSKELGEARSRGCPRAVVDVGGVPFVDASALGVLARTLAAADDQHTTMGFVATSPQFRRVCSMTGLDLVFDLTIGAQRSHDRARSPVARAQ